MGAIAEREQYQQHNIFSQNEDADSYLNYIQHLTERGYFERFDRSIDVIGFYNDFLQQGGDVEYMLPAFFHLKKNQFGGYETGNAGNYFALVAEGATTEIKNTNDILVDFTTERAESAYGETLDNLLSLVAEYPLAETTKVDVRIFPWQKSNKEWHMKTPFGRMDRILEESLISPQTEDFEKKRFEVNKVNYDILRAARARGEQKIFVEFSPSPSPSIAATKRGYLGNDCVFFYSLNEQGEEVVTQRWLRVDREKFGDLLEKLQPEKGRRNIDVEIMNASGFFDGDQINQIEDFIDTNNGSLIIRKQSIDTYVQQELRGFIDREVGSLLRDGAADLIDGKDITPISRTLIETLVYAQLKLRNKLADLTGLKTVAPVQMSNYNMIDFNQMDTNREARAAFFQEHKEAFKLSGCGLSLEEILSTGSSARSSGGIFGKNRGYEFDKQGTCKKCNSMAKVGPCDICEHCVEEIEAEEVFGNAD